MQYILAHKQLVGHAYHLVSSVLVEQDYIVHVRAVGHKLVLLQGGTYESLFAVDVQLFVGFHHLGRFDGVEVAQLGASRIVGPVLVLQHFVPVDGVVYDVSQLEVYFLYLLLDACDVLVGLVLVELQDALHLYFHQSQDVVLGHLAYKLRVVGCQSFVDVFAGFIHVFGLFKLLVLVDAFFDEYLFQRGEVQAFQQFPLAYLQFLA